LTEILKFTVLAIKKILRTEDLLSFGLRVGLSAVTSAPGDGRWLGVVVCGSGVLGKPAFCGT